MNTFDVKYYKDSSLAVWVRRKPVPMENLQFEQIVCDHVHEIIEEGEKVIDFHRSMRWMMFDWGWAIETQSTNEESITTVETLISYTGITATLIHRHRFGPTYNKMKPYQRDDILPVPSIVRLLP